MHAHLAHDAFRSHGSFKRTVEKLALLSEHSIRSNVMFTLYPTNSDQLVPLLRFVAEKTAATSFSFDTGCFVGCGADLEKNFTTEEIRSVFSDYIEEKRRLRAAGNALRVSEKANLLKLARFADHSFYPFSSEEWPVSSGCLIGWTGVAVLSDGTILPCRRLPIRLGKLPEQSFEEIFLGSELLKNFRRARAFEGCGGCDFYQVCRGCPANVHSLTGNPFAANPFCFRKAITRTTDENARRQPDAPLTTGPTEEFELVRNHARLLLRDGVNRFVESRDFRAVFTDLACDMTQKHSFMNNPREYLQGKSRPLDDEMVLFLTLHFGAGPVDDEHEDTLQRYIFNRMLDDVF